MQRGESHSGGPRAGSGNGTRSRYSLEGGDHRGGPSSQKRVRVLQLVLYSSLEGWRVASHFRSASVEPLSQQTEVQDAQTGHVSDQVRGLVCHDRSKRCILPYLHPSHSQGVPEICFRGRSLPISGSSLLPRTLTPHFTKCVDAGLAPLRLQGICILIYIDDWLILTQSEQMAAQHRDVVLAHMKVLGLRLNAKKSVFSPALRTTYLGVVWDSTTMQARMSPARIESILTAVARVRVRDRHVFGPHRQHSGGLLHQPPRRSAFVPPVQAGVPDPWVVLGQTPLAESSSHSWASQYGSRHPVEAEAEARGMDASPRCGEAELESVWPGTGGPLRYSGDSAMSPLVLSNLSSSTGAGCHGTDVAEASSVRFSPDLSAPGSSGESAPGWGQSTSGSTVLAGAEYGSRTWFFSLTALHGRFPSGGISSHRQGSFTPVRRCGSCGGGRWEGTTHSFRSLNQGCWDHPPIQSSLNEETVHLEVETFTSWAETASSTQSTARLVQFWSSSRPVPPQGWPTPHWRVTWRQFGLPHLSWWAISG